MDFELPLHPMVVHLPLVAAFVAAILYALSLVVRREGVALAAVIAAIVAAVGSAGAVWSGDGAHEDLSGAWARVAHEVVENHEEAGEMTLYVLSALAVAGAASLWLGWLAQSGTRAALALLHVAACALVAFTGHLGAELVYRHGAGVLPVRDLEPEDNIFRSHGVPTDKAPSLREESH